jgi:hypothetical protein
MLGARRHLLQLIVADHADGQLDQVAHHRLDIAADVAHLGELRRFDLDEGRLRQPRQAPRNLGLADTGGPDHQDVLRRHIVGHLGRQLLAADAVAQRNRTARLARAWPTTYLSSSATISRGVRVSMAVAVRSGSGITVLRW